MYPGEYYFFLLLGLGKMSSDGNPKYADFTVLNFSVNNKYSMIYKIIMKRLIKNLL